MRSLLSPEHAPVLDVLARERALLAFDFDGTLAPIVADPAAAALPAETRALLRVLGLLYPCAVVSGRSRGDLARRLERVPLVAVVGNHGAEAGFGPVDEGPRLEVVRWREALADRLRGLAGVEIEDKGLSIAVHFRRAVDRARAARLAREAVAALPGARVFGGHEVVNVAPADAPTKGDALVELMRRVRARTALYVGDDVTDEDAFLAPGVVGVRVGQAAVTAAAYALGSQGDVDALLAALTAARRAVDGGPPRVEGLLRAVQA